ncbi:hypothetical protein BDN67DRAFT_207963 [Paxillus ammoniavirescens]|nr:hypothetical protein BDN67DRAFT_207963 [Paxillus ammoniavirescens]
MGTHDQSRGLGATPPTSCEFSLQNVDVIVFVSLPDGSGEAAVHIKALPTPLQFDDIANKLIAAGYPKPTVLVSRRHTVTVTGGPSGHAPDGGWQVNVDQPLLHFYHKVFLANGTEQMLSPCISESELTWSGGAALVSDLKIQFHRWVDSFVLMTDAHRMDVVELFESQVCKLLASVYRSKG